MADFAYSVNGVPIRLTLERWDHIIEARSEMAAYREDCLGCIERPDLVLSGYRGTLIATKGFGRRRYLAVVYRETSQEDGFVITAYFTAKIDRRHTIWRQ